VTPRRPTPLAASLLHCAASGQTAAEVSAVLLGMAGQELLEPAAAKLLAAVQGADLAWGLVAGCRAALVRRTPSADDCALTLPAAFWPPMDNRGIPSGPPALND
jgi:hypothetical protein